MASGWKGLWTKILGWHHPVTVTTPAAAAVVYGPITYTAVTDEITIVDASDFVDAANATDEVTFAQVNR